MKELEINSIVSAQRMLIWAFVFSIVGAATRVPIVWFPIVGFLSFCAYKTSKAMNFSIAASVFWGITMVVPGLSTICILILNYKTTSILKAYGLKVGLLGANPSDFPAKPSSVFKCKSCGENYYFYDDLVAGLCRGCIEKGKEAEKIANNNFSRGEREGRHKEQHQQKHNTTKDASKNSNRVISCPSCKQKIRLYLPIPNGIIRCIICNAKFRAYTDHEDHLYIELIGTNNNKAELNDIVSIDDCFALLELPVGASANDIKSSYRKKMMEYHPDKVSSLGSKLKSLADHESKKLNYALSLLKENGFI